MSPVPRLLVLLWALGIATLPAARAQQPDRAGALLATLTLDRDRAHVDEQVLLTLDVGVPSEAFALNDAAPEPDGARMVRLARHEESRDIAGKPYRFTRTTYALFADAPGPLLIPPIAFRATLPVSAGGSGSTRNPRIEASTDAVRARVDPAPVPDTTPGTASETTWLPAREVTLSSGRDGEAARAAPREVRAGEPFTRQLRIDAHGQRAAAIPPLAIAPVEGLRVYPEPARLESRTAADGLHGSRIESAVIVATRPGPARLPAVTLDWWDTGARVWRTASLPAEPILVLPGATLEATRTGAGWRENPALLAASLLASGLLGAVVATVCQMPWRRRYGAVSGLGPSRGPAAPGPDGALSERGAWRALRRALRRGDARSVRGALARWQRSRRDGGPPGPELDTAVRALQARLYAADAPARPDLAAPGRALRRARRRGRGHGTDRTSGVDLYPTDEPTDER